MSLDKIPDGLPDTPEVKELINNLTSNIQYIEGLLETNEHYLQRLRNIQENTESESD